MNTRLGRHFSCEKYLKMKNSEIHSYSGIVCIYSFLSLLDSMAALIASEVPEHMRRWSKSMRLGTDMDWNKHLQVMRDFLSERPAKEREHINGQSTRNGYYSG